ncbi:PCL7 [Sanghuangporus sanghuang]
MLALAAPPLHDHSPAHTAPVTAGKTPIVRSKAAARRAPSSASLNSAALASSTASSSSFSSSSSLSSTTVVPSSASRSTSSVSHFRSEPSLTAKRQSLSPKSSQPKLADPETSHKNLHSSSSSMLASSPAKDDSISDLQSYPTTDLLRLLASLLNRIATANDGISSAPPHGLHQAGSRQSSGMEHPPIWQSLFTASRVALSTPTSSLTFHARNIPSISLQAYLLRILRYCPTTNEVFLSLLVYFDRMSKISQEATGTRFVIDSYNVHRLVIAGVTVASKFFSDVFYTNSRYARVGGLPQAELNQLELQFLLLNDFRLSIPPDEMQRYWEQLIRFSQAQDAPEGQSIPAAPGPPVSASRPLQSMGAFDAYGGVVVRDNAPCPDPQAPRNATPKRYRSSDVQIVERRVLPDEEEDRDRESSVCSETDTDAETDDEPTIRPAHSCASSDTQSLFSNDASEADVDGDDYGDAELPRDSQRPVPPAHHRWSSAASSVDSSIDGDRLMASP